MGATSTCFPRVEAANAFYAAKRRSGAALVAIESALELMRDTTRVHGRREGADHAFPIAIAEAANNDFSISSMQALKGHINVGMKLHGLSLLGPVSRPAPEQTALALTYICR